MVMIMILDTSYIKYSFNMPYVYISDHHHCEKLAIIDAIITLNTLNTIITTIRLANIEYHSVVSIVFHTLKSN